MQIERHQLIGDELCQLVQFVARRLKKRPLCILPHWGGGQQRGGGRPSARQRWRAAPTVVDQGGAPCQRSTVHMIEGQRIALQLQLA